MGVTGFSFEFPSPVAPARIFKASVLDIHNLAPKIMPEVVSSACLLQGDGGVGSVKHFKFTDAIPYTHVNERVDLLDKDNFEYKYTVTDGADVGSKLISAVYHVKFETASNGGSVCKVTAEYHTASGVEYTEEELNVGKEGVKGMFKGVEEYLLKNGEAYA
ncbi:major strawberry allergen Fra a 1.08-like [Magnolia sinica]|uniref:major strawberry allergen Fra a 1.08-like n=1 Tax=Magnolia sinica TaxID=86752 RepID=UPI00265AB766|nr:major strawberry allergen Fra a 1.08-like [Magnolia sinica]